MIERYSTEDMTRIFSDEARFARWTRIEVAASEAFAARGEIPEAEMRAIRAAQAPSAERVAEHEKVTDHDVVAFVRALGDNVGEPARRHLHRGLTSSDVVDTALAMGVVEALDVLLGAARELTAALFARATEHAHTPCAGRTHGVHAEPTTFGLKLLGFAAEAQRNVQRLERAQRGVAFGKLSGAVGTYSQTDPDLEQLVLSRVGLKVEPVATQVVPRDRHAEVFMALAVLGTGIERLGTEVRALQRTEVREAEERFKPGQTGSSAMPHKRNPILSERLCGMARILRGYVVPALEDVALWHERDISHSSVERVILPDAFQLAHYMTQKARSLVEGLVVYPEAMRANIERTGGLLFSQSVLGALLDAGLERQEAYKAVQAAAMRVWDGAAPTLRQALNDEPLVTQTLTAEALDAAFSLERYTRHVDAIFERAKGT